MPLIDTLEASAFTIPTDRPEADGTLEWDATTIIVVEVGAAGLKGLGYSYAEAGAAGLITRMLAPTVVGLDAMAVPAAWTSMVRAVRNVGWAGVASGAIAAVDAPSGISRPAWPGWRSPGPSAVSGSPGSRNRCRRMILPACAASVTGVPAGMDVTAGEYGYDITYFGRMVGAAAVDVLQADATRCGITGLLQAAALCQARSMPLSAHTAPALPAHVCCALEPVRHVEWFHDHVRIERMLFDGVLDPVHGRLVPDRDRPGHGLIFKRADAERWAVPA